MFQTLQTEMQTYLRGAARQSRRGEKDEIAAFMDWR